MVSCQEVTDCLLLADDVIQEDADRPAHCIRVMPHLLSMTSLDDGSEVTKGLLDESRSVCLFVYLYIVASRPRNIRTGTDLETSRLAP